MDWGESYQPKNICTSSGGSCGLGALGPAILWGPLQGCDPTFPSWGVGAGAQGALSPTTVSGAEPPRQSILAGIYWTFAENQVSWSPSA